MNERSNFLKWVLCDLIMDLTISTEVFRDVISSESFDPHVAKSRALIRMVRSSLVVNLSKLWEALNHFGKVINELPEPLRTECLEIRKKIENKKIYQLRSKYTAHLIDKETNQMLSLADGEERIQQIFGHDLRDLSDFCDWICSPTPKLDDSSVTSIISRLRDYCRDELGGSGSRP